MGGPPLKCTRFVRTAVRAATGCRRGLVRSARPRTHPSILVGNRPISAHASLVALNVSCRRGEEWLFRDFSFSIQPGELVWLRGQNGSGKTSLLRIAAGLSRPEGGTVTVSGGRPGAYIGHANALKDDLTVTESLAFLARLHGLECPSQRINAALRTLAIHHRRHAFVRTLSQGQRRRVALARLALEHEPSLWILDEPFDALDTQGIEAVNQLLAAHLARRGSVFLTSHLALSLPDTPVSELEFPAGAPP